jgi:IS4 transposase
MPLTSSGDHHRLTVKNRATSTSPFFDHCRGRQDFTMPATTAVMLRGVASAAVTDTAG